MGHIHNPGPFSMILSRQNCAHVNLYDLHPFGNPPALLVAPGDCVSSVTLGLSLGGVNRGGAWEE